MFLTETGLAKVFQRVRSFVASQLNSKASVIHTHTSSDITDLYNLIYPIGSIYLSVNSVDPSTLFGGTWEKIKDKFLLSDGDTYSIGSTGGEATHTLTIDEMPSHNHSMIKASDGTAWAAMGWPESASAAEHGPSNWGTSSAPKVQGVGAGYTGGSGAHNNMPPYLAVYMWKRTA